MVSPPPIKIASRLNSINLHVKIQDIIDTSVGQSPLGSDPHGFTIHQSKDGGSFRAYADDAEDDRPAAILKLNGYTIESIDVEEEYASAASGIMTALLRAACEHFDRNNAIAVVHPNSIEDVKVRRFLERFGFIPGHKGLLERRPGASLPYSVLI